MDVSTFSKSLIEDAKVDLNPAQDFLDRVLLRIFNNASLLSYLDKTRVVDDDTVELSFYSIPDESIDVVKQILNSNKIKVFMFSTDKFSPKTGFRVTGLRNYTEA